MKKIVVALALSAMASTAMAATPSVTTGITFKRADTNHTGKGSWKEVHAALPMITLAQFKAADKNRNGWLSITEFDTLPGTAA